MYLGRKIEVPQGKGLPKDHKVKGNVNEICIPFEKFLRDPEEEEQFKLLGGLTIHNMGSGYTCFVSSFALFVSDREIKVSKSAVIKAFEDINTIEKFLALDLPIINTIKCPDDTKNTAFEIDLSRTR